MKPAAQGFKLPQPYDEPYQAPSYCFEGACVDGDALREDEAMANMVYKELGFPVLLVDVEVVEVRGEQVPNVNLKTLQDSVFGLLITKPARLTGAEVRFVRKHLRLRQVDLALALNMSRISKPTARCWKSRLAMLHEVEP
ncbi:MAG: hypothetical protein EXR76_13195 [Myxococcales bacterium]|nr:hypothetical protein [Myxococcales bacterium]